MTEAVLMIRVSAVVRFLNRELRIAEFADESHNGLQVANSGRVTRIACGVDASLEFVQAAVLRGADLLICHHGISWGDSLKTLTGANYLRVAPLIRGDLALYACHLPLDAHPRLGNNAGICRALGLRRLKPFGWYKGRQIGFRGELPQPLPRARFCDAVANAVGPLRGHLDFGRPTVRTVGVVSGGAAEEVAEAAEAGLDAFVTGEPSLNGYNLARDLEVNTVFAGHYATERFGVQAVAKALGNRFGIPWDFLDLKVPY